ncbi:DUF6783 domain-containing protein [Anaerobutyricum hallii]
MLSANCDVQVAGMIFQTRSRGACRFRKLRVRLCLRPLNLFG